VFDLFQDQLPKPSFPSRSSLQLEEELRVVSWSELQSHIDVFEETGEVRTGLFVGNNPVNWMDPFGLVNLNLTNPGDQVYTGLSNFNPPGFYSVGGHGTNYGYVEDSRESAFALQMFAKELASEIKAKNKEGQPIYLAICYAA